MEPFLKKRRDNRITGDKKDKALKKDGKESTN
jgi:hypothetical protein